MKAIHSARKSQARSVRKRYLRRFFIGVVASLAMGVFGCGSETSSTDTSAGSGDASVSAAAGGGAQSTSGQGGGVVGSGGSGGGTGERFELTVEDGYGSGSYPAGAKVHVFAKQDPYASVVTGWTSDAPAFEVASEWHAVITMPARDLRLSPVITPVSMVLEEQNWQGVQNQKRLVYAIPPNPKGILFLFHGTGGSADLIYKPGAHYLARLAFHRGYIVASTEAEERTVGDPGADGKIRWNSLPILKNNVDLQNIQKLSEVLGAQAALPVGAPRFAAGMSNGGAFAISVGAALSVTAVTSYCAPGVKAAAEVTVVPSQWLMCENDLNATVSALKSIWKEGHDILVTRQVPTDYGEHPSSPVFDGRFARIEGVAEAQSMAAVADLLSKNKLDDGGFLNLPPSELLAEIQAAPSTWPGVVSVIQASSALAFFGQIKQAYADHQMFGDWAARMLDFMEAQRLP